MELVKSLWEQVQDNNKPTKTNLTLDELKDSIKSMFCGKQQPVLNTIPGALLLNLPDKEFISLVNKSDLKVICNSKQHTLIQERLKQFGL